MLTIESVYTVETLECLGHGQQVGVVAELEWSVDPPDGYYRGSIQCISASVRVAWGEGWYASCRDGIRHDYAGCRGRSAPDWLRSIHDAVVELANNDDCLIDRAWDTYRSI